MASIDVGIHPDPAGITAHHFAASRTSNRFSTLVCEVNESRVAIFIDSRNKRGVLDALQAALDAIRADMDAAAPLPICGCAGCDVCPKVDERPAPLPVCGCAHAHALCGAYCHASASDQVPTVMADWPAGPPGEFVEIHGK